MSFKTTFKVGSFHSNSNIIAEFKCGNMGGMRKSNTTDTLVIISDFTKGLYEDKWFGDVLHYTGMGKSGDQTLDFMQNKTLSESLSNGIDVHLFEVFVEGQYVYKGLVDLCEAPYQQMQKGDDGLLRKAWIFPVKLRSGDIPTDINLLSETDELKKKQLEGKSLQELKQRAEETQSDKVGSRTAMSKVYLRNQAVVEHAKKAANGICQLCGDPAPFCDPDRRPYLEAHHIDWLSEDGPDTIKNTIALCPNCHRKMHVLNLAADKKKLVQTASTY